jgi:hypothetical protein
MGCQGAGPTGPGIGLQQLTGGVGCTGPGPQWIGPPGFTGTGPPGPTGEGDTLVVVLNGATVVVTPVTFGVTALVVVEVDVADPVPVTEALAEPVDVLEDDAANAVDDSAVRLTQTKYLVRLFMIHSLVSNENELGQDQTKW